MTVINIDTVRLRECGEDLLKAVDDYDGNLKGLFDRLDGVPEKTKEWTGGASLRYTKSVNDEKINYYNHANSLKKLGQALVSHADDLEAAINKTKLGG